MTTVYSDSAILNYSTTAVVKMSAKNLYLMLVYCNELASRNYSIDSVYRTLCDARIAKNPFNAVGDVLKGVRSSKKGLYKEIVKYLL